MKLTSHFLGAAMALIALAATVLPATAAQASSAESADKGRIVSIGSAVTETIFALGKGDRVVAVDTTSTYPPAAHSLPNVGYMRALSPEGVLSLRPDLIVADGDSGPVTTIDALKASNVPVALIPAGLDPDGIATRIEAIAEVVGAEAAGATLAEKLKGDFAALDKAVAKVEMPLRVAFVLSVQAGRPMVAGAGTGADAMIRLAGGVNAFSDLTGYKPVTDEAVITAAPDVVLMMDRAGHSISAVDLFALPSFAMVPAAGTKRLIAMDGPYLLGFGPRSADAARDLAARLYPDLITPASGEPTSN